jgi:hypothetical protein
MLFVMKGRMYGVDILHIVLTECNEELSRIQYEANM